jgi:hypothetical protein
MSRRKKVILCLICLILAGWTVLVLSGPPLWVREGMTYEEVEQVLGKQLHGLRPVSPIDGSWTGVWLAAGGWMEVTFDSNNRVREAPSLPRSLLTRLLWIGDRRQ